MRKVSGYRPILPIKSVPDSEEFSVGKHNGVILPAGFQYVFEKALKIAPSPATANPVLIILFTSYQLVVGAEMEFFPPGILKRERCNIPGAQDFSQLIDIHSSWTPPVNNPVIFNGIGNTFHPLAGYYPA